MFVSVFAYKPLTSNKQLKDFDDSSTILIL